MSKILKMLMLIKNFQQHFSEKFSPKMFVLCVDFPSASALPHSSLARLSPDETAHALVFTIAERITAKAPEQMAATMEACAAQHPGYVQEAGL